MTKDQRAAVDAFLEAHRDEQRAAAALRAARSKRDDALHRARHRMPDGSPGPLGACNSIVEAVAHSRAMIVADERAAPGGA